MTQQTSCPNCRKPLYIPSFKDNQPDQLDLLCSACHYRYQLVYGTITRFSYGRDTSYSSWIDPDDHKTIIYDFEICLPSQRLKSGQFHLRPDETFNASPGDQVWILYAYLRFFRQERSRKLAIMTNCTSNQQCKPYKMIAYSTLGGITIGTGTFMLLIALNLPFDLLPLKKIAAIAAPLSTVAGIVANRRFRSEENDRLLLSQLLPEQELLAREKELEDRIAVLRQDLRDCQRSIAYQAEQKLKMAREQDIYSRQINNINTIIAAFEDKRCLLENLISGYQQDLNRLDINYSISVSNRELPDHFSNDVFYLREELKALEGSLQEKAAELRLLLDPQHRDYGLDSYS